MKKTPHSACFSECGARRSGTTPVRSSEIAARGGTAQPVGQKHELRRHRRAIVPVPLAEDREIDSRERVRRLDAAQAQDHLARPDHVRRVAVVAGELQGEVGLHRDADVGRPSFVVGPSAARQLLAPEVLGRLLDPLLARPPEEVQGQDVLGLEDRVALELAAPVAVRPLNGKQIALRGGDSVAQAFRGHLRDALVAAPLFHEAA